MIFGDPLQIFNKENYVPHAERKKPGEREDQIKKLPQQFVVKINPRRNLMDSSIQIDVSSDLEKLDISELKTNDDIHRTVEQLLPGALRKVNAECGRLVFDTLQQGFKRTKMPGIDWTPGSRRDRRKAQREMQINYSFEQKQFIRSKIFDIIKEEITLRT